MCPAHISKIDAKLINYTGMIHCWKSEFLKSDVYSKFLLLEEKKDNVVLENLGSGTCKKAHYLLP